MCIASPSCSLVSWSCLSRLTVFFVAFLTIPFCVLVLVPVLFLLLHLPCISLIGPALFPVFITAMFIFSCFFTSFPSTVFLCQSFHLHLIHLSNYFVFKSSCQIIFFSSLLFCLHATVYCILIRFMWPKHYSTALLSVKTSQVTFSVFQFLFY